MDHILLRSLGWCTAKQFDHQCGVYESVSKIDGVRRPHFRLRRNPVVRGCSWTARLRRTIRKLFWCVAASVAVVDCSPQNQLVVINQSNLQLRDVVASGFGFSAQVGTIAPHQERRVVIHCPGESGLRLTFKAGGKDVSFGPDGYFEGSGGYLITAAISKDLGVTVKSQLTHY